jgi:RNA polymerase sigma-70 factor (ECF subfamily)
VRVRLHRARRALGRQLTLSCRTCAEHGCFDCSCQTTTGPQRSQRAQR